MVRGGGFTDEVCEAVLFPVLFAPEIERLREVEEAEKRLVELEAEAEVMCLELELELARSKRDRSRSSTPPSTTRPVGSLPPQCRRGGRAPSRSTPDARTR